MLKRRNESDITDNKGCIRAAAPPTGMPPKMAAPPSAAPAAGIGLNLESLCGFVRDIRAEAQNLMKSLSEIKGKSQLADKKVRALELKAALAESFKIFSYNKIQIDGYIGRLRDLLLRQPNLHNLYGDEIAIIENLWQRASESWPTPELDDEGEVSRRVTKVEQELNELIFHAGYLTIPIRVDHHLKQLRIGRSLDFHSTFEDELPNYEDRMKILRLMETHPLSIQGVVDVESGKIFRASTNRWRRLASYLLMIGVFLAGAFVVYLFANVGNWLGLQDWPAKPDRFAELIVAYLFMSLGGVAHIGVDSLKQARAGKGQGFIALEDMLLWVHVRELSIITGAISLLIGTLAMAILTPKVEWQTAFFVGYSIDSFIDLFLQRFALTATTSTEAIKATLG